MSKINLNYYFMSFSIDSSIINLNMWIFNTIYPPSMIHMRKEPSIFNHHLWGLKCWNGVWVSNSLMLGHFFHQQNVIVEQHSLSGSVLTKKRRVIITLKTTKRICRFQKLPTAALTSQPNPSTHRPPRV